MCGICGIISKNNETISKVEIENMNNLITHRGPDSGAFYQGNNFAFGHRRLKIIDLSDCANQPMTYLNRYTITYNGEIYNYIEMRDVLQKIGYSFSTASDTEVILAAYDHYGFDCVTKFNGMWAFALYDKEKEVIFCSRDRFGVKPFYYTNSYNKFLFSSEIKQLIGYQNQNRVNRQVLIDYLVVGYEDHTNDTFFQDIHQLEQSHNLIYNLRNNTFSIERYYEITIDAEVSNLNEIESVNLYKNALYESIKLRLRSDVKVGTCLSGGLDSSSVAAIASSFYRQKLSTQFTAITAKSTEPEFDETRYAENVSHKSHLNWNVIMPSAKDFLQNIDKIISVQEEPFGSPSVFMQFKVFEKAKELGCVVMLDGQGGDETLLGYERYYPAYLLSQNLLTRFSGFFNSSKNSGLSKKNLFLYLFYFTNPSIRLTILRNKFSFIRKDYFNLINYKNIKESSKSYSDIITLQKIELMKLQLPHLLKYEDRNSMYHSIEARLPFIDYRLVETALSIDNRYKIKDGWTKYLLRKSVEGILPDEILWRKNKIGFNAPEKTWMISINKQIKSSLAKSEILNRIIKDGKVIKKFDQMDLRVQWRLFNIAKWEEIFNVRID
jgi:asparagine synthase (glutamine-hydrolysing)